MPAQLVAGYMSTQAFIIASQNVALKVTDYLRLQSSPMAREFVKNQPENASSVREWLAASLIKKLDVQTDKDSNLITVSYSGTIRNSLPMSPMHSLYRTSRPAWN